MGRLVELVSNKDGTLSRTQCAIIFLLLVATGLIIAHVIETGKVLSKEVMGSMAFLHLYVLGDRCDARRIDLKIGKDGAHVSLGGNGNGRVDAGDSGGSGGSGGVGGS